MELFSQRCRNTHTMNRDSATWISATRLWIPIGAALFTVALIVSALVIPQLRLLHLLQALIYVAIVILARRNSMWGVGAGLTIAVVWNSLNLFVTHNMQRGAVAFWSLLLTGHMQELVPMMVMLGGIGHFVLISACLAALFDRRIKDKKPWKMVVGGVVALAYFALIIIVARPR
jgi:hypothetical protein